MASQRKPRCYWTKDNVVEGLKSIVKAIGKFPTWYDLRDNGHGTLASYITKYGGMVHFKELLGCKVTKRPNGELKSAELVEVIIRAKFSDMIANKTFPTAMQFCRAKLSSLVAAICKHHGGFPVFAERMGCYVPGVFKTTDGHFVYSANEYEFDEFLYSRGIKHDYNQVIDISESRKFRYDFKVEINDKIHYVEIWGFKGESSTRCAEYQKKRREKEKLYSDLNLSLVSLEKEFFLKSVDKIERDLVQLVQSLGHNGKPNVIDYDISVTPRLLDKNMTREHLKEVTKQLGHFPTSTELWEMKKSSLVAAMYRYGGINYWRKELGENEVTKSPGYWTETTTIEALKKLMSDTGEFPNMRSLWKTNGGLHNAILRNGGVNYFKTKLGVKLDRISPGTITKDVVIKELISLKENLGRFPGLQEFADRMGNNAWAFAISRMGGIRRLREQCEEEIRKGVES